MYENHHLTAQSLWQHTCPRRNAYFLVWKAHLRMSMHFFKHWWSKSASLTVDIAPTITSIVSPIRGYFFFPFTPHPLPFPITVSNPARPGTLLQVLLSSRPLPSFSCERESIIHKQEAHNTALRFFSTSHKELDIWAGWENERVHFVTSLESTWMFLLFVGDPVNKSIWISKRKDGMWEIDLEPSWLLIHLWSWRRSAVAGRWEWK